MMRLWLFFTGSVRRQLITGVALVHAVMMSVFVLDLVVRQQDMLLTQQITHAKALSQSVATSSGGWLMARDVIGLQEIIEAQQGYPELAFAMAVDREGRILAHTDSTKRGLFLEDLPQNVALKVMSESVVLADIITPVSVAGEHVGWIRVGIGQQVSRTQMANVVRDGLVYTALAILIGVILASYIGSHLTRRLYAIQKVADNIKQGSLSERTTIGGTDEAARLAREFNDMLDALELTRTELSATLQAIPDLLFELDQDGRYLNIWARDQEQLALHREELLGHTVSEVLPVEAATTVMGALQVALKEGLSQGETISLILDGAERWFELSTSLKSSNELESHFIMLSRDITERKQAEDALKRSEAFSRSIIENSPECVKIIDKNGLLEYMNPTGLKLIEADSLGSVAGRSVYSLVTPKYQDDFIDLTKRVLNGESGSLRFEIRGLKGTVRLLETRAVPLLDANGEVESLLGMTRDISEQRYLRMEHEQDQIKLRESEASLNRAQRIAHVGSWELDLKNDELLWSDEVYRTLGLSPNQVSPSHQIYCQAIHPADKKRVEETISESIKSGRSYDLSYRLQLQDDSIRYIRERNETVRDEQGQPLRISGTIQDVTTQQVKDEQLHRSQKMDAMGNLTGGIAHDFNNMIGVILGYAELLQLQLVENSKQGNYVGEIQNAADRARKLTSKLLSFSRKEAISVEQVDINQLLKDSQHMLEKSLTARIELRLELGKDIWPIELERALLEDAILNMSINAMHAMPDGGRLSVETRNIHLDGAGFGHLQLEPGDYILLSLADTGMDRETQEKVFDPFFSTKGEKGTGLGMSQVYSFVRQSKGVINLESKLGHGSRFDLYFPRSLSSQLEDRVAPSENSIDVAKGSETILVVDDEPALRELASEILSSQGYRVLMANSGAEALQLLQQERVDLMLSDVIMPVMDGYKLAEQVQIAYPEVKIQMISGFDGGDGFGEDDDHLRKNRLSKPISSKALLQRIREILDQLPAKELTLLPEAALATEVLNDSGELVALDTLTPLEWSQELSCGIDAIDEDHKRLLVLINRCVEMVKEEGTQGDIAALLAELLDYTDDHFRREELIMEVCDYTNIAQHRKAHESLLDELKTSVRDFGSGKKSIHRLLSILLEWLASHVNGMDKEITAFCEGNGEKIRQALAKSDTDPNR